MFGKTPWRLKVLLPLLLGNFFFPATHGYGALASDKIKVFVSILPQAYFAERVGGKRVHISVLVGPGQSPATYEPRPKQMAELSRAKLYFRVGVPFENVWIDRISKANTNMKVIDTRRGIKLMPMKAHHHGRHQGHDVRGKDRKDPHIWLSPRLVKLQAQNICNALTAADPAHRVYYRDNLRGFENDLDRLDAEVTEILHGLKRRQFLVFHPTWGYFARDYGLEQVPIEREGKEATAKALASLIDEANEKGIKVIFVQQQFSKKSAETVANAIGGKVVQVDPLSKDYLENMKKIAQAFREVMQMNE